MSAIHLELDQFATVDAYGPGGVDLGDQVALQLEDRVGGVVGGGGVLAALLIPALRDVGHGFCRHGLHLAKEILEHVVPMRKHVEHHAAAILRAVIPARPLGWQQISLKTQYPNSPRTAKIRPKNPESISRFNLSSPGR